MENPKEAGVAKGIVFCADGTWNGPGRDPSLPPCPYSPGNIPLP